MRKLAPMFITTSILALAAGNVLANDMSSTDKTGSPTVSSNTNKQPLSYSDKSNSAKGTNAPMRDNATMGMSTSDKATRSDSVNSSTSFATDEDKADVKEQSNRKESAAADTPTTKHHKVKKAKVAHHTKMHKDTVARDDTVTNTDTEKSMKNPPLSATKGEAANSTTGKSAGQ
jgi:type IV secretory pathway TrbL component